MNRITREEYKTLLELLEKLRLSYCEILPRWCSLYARYPGSWTDPEGIAEEYGVALFYEPDHVLPCDEYGDRLGVIHELLFSEDAWAAEEERFRQQATELKEATEENERVLLARLIDKYGVPQS